MLPGSGYPILRFQLERPSLPVRITVDRVSQQSDRSLRRRWQDCDQHVGRVVLLGHPSHDRSLALDPAGIIGLYDDFLPSSDARLTLFERQFLIQYSAPV